MQADAKVHPALTQKCAQRTTSSCRLLIPQNQTAEQILQLMGDCYVQSTNLYLSRQHVSSTPSRAALSLEAAAHSATSRFTTLRAAAAAHRSSLAVGELETAVSFVEVLWTLARVDVEETIAQVLFHHAT